MFFRLFSDLHNEFSNFQLPPLDTDKDDVLVLAGDIGVAKQMNTFDIVKEWAPRFRQVIQLAGNHEFYHGSMLRARTKIREHLKDIPNWILADKNVVRVDNVSFICATLWTDFNKSDPWAMNAIRSGLNDYNFIRTGDLAEPYRRTIRPMDILQEHFIDRDFIFKSITEEKYIDGQKIVVVSHHAPTTLSVHARYGNDVLNWAYVSDLSNQILDTQPNIWVHGHTHSSFHYKMGETDVWANPRGYAYPNAVPENQNFNPTLRIEV